MTDVLALSIQIGLLIALAAIFYAIFQVVEVIREERERLMWYRHVKSPVRTEDDDSAK